MRSSEIPVVGMSTDICQSKNSASISSQDSTANQLIKVNLQNDCYASVCIAYFANTYSPYKRSIKLLGYYPLHII